MAGFDFQHFLQAVTGQQTGSQSSDNVQTPPRTTITRDSAASSSQPLANGMAASSSERETDRPQLGSGRRSNAANVLAAAAAAGTPTEQQPAAPEPQGRALPPDDMVVYHIEDRLPGEAQPQLEVSPITMYNSDFNLELTRQIAASNEFICYGLKQGHLRVLHKTSADRALLKGHALPLTDLRFFSDTVNLLASAGKDSRVMLWQLRQGAAGIVGEPLRALLLSDAAGPLVGVRLAWHPSDQGMLAVCGGHHVLLVALQRLPAGGAETAVDLRAPPAGVAELPGTIDGPVTSVAFAPSGRRLAAGGEDGKVRVWSLEWNGAAGARLEAELAPYMGAPTGCLEWAPGSSGVLLVGNAVNGEVQLEALEGDTSATLQTLLLESGEGQEAFFNHVVVHPAARLVLLANSKRNAVYAVHLSGSGQEMRFDYLAEFSVTMPILSVASMAGLQRAAEGEAPLLHLYCVQTQAIQQYSLDPALARPPEADAADRPGAVAASAAAAPQLPPIAVSAPAPTAVFSPSAPPAPPSPARRDEAGSSSAASLAPPVPVMREPAVQVHPPSPPSDREDGYEPEPPRPAERWGRGGARDEAEAPGTPPGGAAFPGPPQVPQAELEPERPTTPTSLPAALALPPQPGLLTPTALMKQAQLTSASRSASLASEPIDEITPPPRPTFSPRPSTSSDLPSSSFSAAHNGRGSGGGSQRGHSPAPVAEVPAVRLLRRGKAAADAPPPATQEAVATALAAAAPEAGDSSGASTVQANGVDNGLAAVLEAVAAGQRRLAAQVAAAQRDTVKAVKVELAREVKRLETATDARLAKLLKSHLQQLKEERAAAAAEEGSGLERLQAGLGTALQQELPAHLQAALQGQLTALQASLAAAVKAALLEAPPKGQGGAGGEALDKAAAAAMAGQVAAGLARPLADALRSSFQKQLLPGFEAATQAMFGQVSAALAQGLQEYRHAAEANTAALTRSLQDTLSQASGVVESLKADLAEGQRKLVEAAAQAGPAPGGGLAGAASLQEVEARHDPTLQLSHLIKGHRFEEAFNKALSLANVDMVTWLCSHVDTAILTQEPAPLSQGVVLSLVQQLGYDLTRDLDTKLTWIREAAIALNPQDPLMAPHMRPILGAVYTNLQELAARSSGAELSNVRMIMHLINSLLSMCP